MESKLELSDIARKLMYCCKNTDLECIGINWENGVIKEYKEYYWGANDNSNWSQEQKALNKDLITYGYSIGNNNYNNTERLTFRVKEWRLCKESLKNRMTNFDYVDKSVSQIRKVLYNKLNTHKEPVVQIGFKKDEDIIKIYFTLRRFDSEHDYKGVILDNEKTIPFFSELLRILNVNYSINQFQNFQKQLSWAGYYPSLMSVEINRIGEHTIKLYFEMKDYDNDQEWQLKKNKEMLIRCNVTQYEQEILELFFNNGFYLRGVGIYINPIYKMNQIKYYYFPFDKD